MFDDRLKLLRTKKGLNMKQAAELLKIPYTTYVGYEKNEREPNSEVLTMLADFYNCSTDYLVGRSKFEKQNQISNVPYTAFQFDYSNVDLSKYFDIELKAITEHWQEADIDTKLQVYTDLGIPLVGVANGENMYKKLSKIQRKTVQDFLFKNSTNEKELQLLQNYMKLNSDGETALFDILEFLLSKEKYANFNQQQNQTTKANDIIEKITNHITPKYDAKAARSYQDQHKINFDVDIDEEDLSAAKISNPDEE